MISAWHAIVRAIRPHADRSARSNANMSDQLRIRSEWPHCVRMDVIGPKKPIMCFNYEMRPRPRIPDPMAIAAIASRPRSDYGASPIPRRSTPTVAFHARAPAPGGRGAPAVRVLQARVRRATTRWPHALLGGLHECSALSESHAHDARSLRAPDGEPAESAFYAREDAGHRARQVRAWRHPQQDGICEAGDCAPLAPRGGAEEAARELPEDLTIAIDTVLRRGAKIQRDRTQRLDVLRTIAESLSDMRAALDACKSKEAVAISAPYPRPSTWHGPRR